ncbi:hypothetical protein [Variovorax sp. JS1663]|uniref:hypothetical protein n=1 Tax=Variovorax sp. JS1663 TaxID=1851577 RepID=UPI001302A402|nr:hypothetical protein [Variovorax sp. JS1663]
MANSATQTTKEMPIASAQADSPGDADLIGIRPACSHGQHHGDDATCNVKAVHRRQQVEVGRIAGQQDAGSLHF